MMPAHDATQLASPHLPCLHGLSSWEVKDSVREGVPCQPGVFGTSWEASLPDAQRAEG